MTVNILDYRPPRIAMALVLVATVAHGLTPLRTVPVYSSTILAVALTLCGFTVMMSAWWQFKQSQVAICPTAEAARLLTDGIYRVTRNPMYLGMTMMLVALALWVGTAPFYGAAIVFFLIIQQAFCPYEEDKLSRAFGAHYESYTAEVRRWL